MYNKTILIVDDDRDMHGLLRARLESEGYNIISAYSGEQALELIRERGLPHLVLVDIYMPGMSGLEFCRQLHTFTDIPVIMMTAESGSDVMVGSIELFAEDYIVKPFNARELVARVQRLMLRIRSFDYVTEPEMRIDEHLSINFGRQYVVVDGEHVDLTPTETKLLYILLSNLNQIVTLEFLLNRLWSRQEVFEDALRVHIHRLRAKIEDKAANRVYIMTERGLGYRLTVTNPQLIRYDFSNRKT